MANRGLTLIELLVSLSIFVVLGASLVVFLRDGMATWRVGEIRRETYERAGAILDQIADDLHSTFTDPDPGDDLQPVEVLFLSDFDSHDRQRLRFVRTLSGEIRHPITREAGALTGGLADYDFLNDALESRLGVMRAPGGLVEVAYLHGAALGSEVIWRGIKGPIGGENSLFDEVNLTVGEEGTPMRCRPLADGVIYLEFNYWGAEIPSWSRNTPAPRSIFWWDSTRGIIEPPRGLAIPFDRASRNEHRDDVFPSKVEVVLVLRPARSTRLARLTTELDSSADTITVDSTVEYPENAFPFIRIDDEWVRYTTKTRRAFVGCVRGVRGSEAVEHPRGTRVVHGTTFSRVVRIPTTRDSRWVSR